MKSFYYSLEKDKTAWWLVLISVIGLFVCYFDIGIQWPPVAKKATEVFSNILVSSLSGCIFYLIVNTVSIYSTRKFKLKVISDALIEMRALIIDIHHHFSCAYNSGNESVIGRSLTQEDKNTWGLLLKTLGQCSTQLIHSLTFFRPRRSDDSARSPPQIVLRLCYMDYMKKHFHHRDFIIFLVEWTILSVK